MKQLFEIQGPVILTGWQSARSCRQRQLHTWPALLLQPPPLRIFTMTPNCPLTHTHFPWSLRGTNWHIYMLMFPIGCTSSSSFFFLSVSSQPNLPLYLHPELFSQLHFSSTTISFLSDSSSTPPLWDIFGQATWNISPSLLPSSPTSHPPYHPVNNTFLRRVAPAEETGE